MLPVFRLTRMHSGNLQKPNGTGRYTRYTSQLVYLSYIGDQCDKVFYESTLVDRLVELEYDCYVMDYDFE